MFTGTVTRQDFGPPSFILTTSDKSYRLVLSSDETGWKSFEILDVLTADDVVQVTGVVDETQMYVGGGTDPALVVECVKVLPRE